MDRGHGAKTYRSILVHYGNPRWVGVTAGARHKQYPEARRDEDGLSP